MYTFVCMYTYMYTYHIYTYNSNINIIKLLYYSNNIVHINKYNVYVTSILNVFLLQI